MKNLIFIVLALLTIQLTSCIKNDVIDYDVMIELKFFKDNQNISNQYNIDTIKVHTGCLIPTRAQPIKHADTSLVYGLIFCCRGDSATVEIGNGTHFLADQIDKFKIHLEYQDTILKYPCEIIGASSFPNYSEVSYDDKKITVSITE